MNVYLCFPRVLPDLGEIQPKTFAHNPVQHLLMPWQSVKGRLCFTRWQK